MLTHDIDDIVYYCYTNDMDGTASIYLAKILFCEVEIVNDACIKTSYYIELLNTTIETDPNLRVYATEEELFTDSYSALDYAIAYFTTSTNNDTMKDYVKEPE